MAGAADRARPPAAGPHAGIGNPYYRSGDALRAKHVRGPAPASGRDFVRWALDLLAVEPAGTVLDAGAGWGRFTWPLIDSYHVPCGNITACDASQGMVGTLHTEVLQRGERIQVCVAEIEALPLRSGWFDVALANHVLYHAASIPRAARELARVLKGNGRLLATTNSERVRVPIIELHYAALERLGIPYEPEGSSRFSMENGGKLLSSAFHRVEEHHFVDEQIYGSVSDFVDAYARIGRYQIVMLRGDVPDGTKRQILPTFADLARELADGSGRVRTPIGMGAFICGEPKIRA